MTANDVTLLHYAQVHRLYRRDSTLPYLYRGYAREAIAEMVSQFGCTDDEAVDAIHRAAEFEHAGE